MACARIRIGGRRFDSRVEWADLENLEFINLLRSGLVGGFRRGVVTNLPLY